MTEPCAPILWNAGGELLLELLSEEIPAGMQRRAIADLAGLLRDRLAAAELPAAEMRGYATPRRLTVIAEGIPTGQLDRSEERRGPRVGAPAPAIDGFLRSAGLASIEECEIRDTGRGEFYFAKITRPGRPAAEVLPELVRSAIFELPWPKSMRYPASSLRWVRPLTSVVCLFEGEVLPLPLDQVQVGRTTRGHRFLSPGEICVATAAEYLERLGKAHIVLDQERRKEIIRKDLETAAADEGFVLKPDPGLLDEVTGLVEFPVVLAGAIDAEYMALPPEVMATAMRTHQKYFSSLDPGGAPAPRFLFVANNIAVDGGRTIVAGNERVLRARLADARFFWEQDQKVRLEARVEALKGRVYHEKLGSVYDKVMRMRCLTAILVPFVKGAAENYSLRAALLSKADLSTGMVGEFPELQGIIGRYYARNDGEDRSVAEAIADHYKPLGPSDTCPTARDSIVVALADKIDVLVSFFAIGEKPTGSGDPFALRRAALGLIRLILEHEIQTVAEDPLRLPLRVVFSEAYRLLDGQLRSSGRLESEMEDPTEELLAFIADRLKVHFRGEGFRHDLITAVFVPVGGRKAEDDLKRLHNRVHALNRFLKSKDGENLLTAYRRASNIVAIEERRDGSSYSEQANESLFRQPEEHALAARLERANRDLQIWLSREDFVGAMSILALLRQSVDAFFEKVTVNAEEPARRENRLRLLSRIRDTMNQVADFSQIEG